MEISIPISSRKEAQLNGHDVYFTGKPCKRGHLTIRKTLDGSCKGCRLAMYELNKEQIIARATVYNKTHKDRRKQTVKNFYESHLEQIKKYRDSRKDITSEYNKKYRIANKEKSKKYGINYRKLNKPRILQISKKHCAIRRARKKQAVPLWANMLELELIYKNCPEGYVVDHIIPLQGKYICGLHVSNNLQYLTKSENSKKNNKFEPQFIINTEL